MLEKRAEARAYLADIRDRFASYKQIVADLRHAEAIFNDSLPEPATDRVCLLSAVAVSLTSAYAVLATAAPSDTSEAFRQLDVVASSVAPDNPSDSCPGAPYWQRVQINRAVGQAGIAEIRDAGRHLRAAIAILDTVATLTRPESSPDDHLLVIRDRAELLFDLGRASERRRNMRAAQLDALEALRYTPDSDKVSRSKAAWIEAASRAYVAELDGSPSNWKIALRDLDSTLALLSPRGQPLETAFLQERIATLVAWSSLPQNRDQARRLADHALSVISADQYPHLFARLIAAKHKMLIERSAQREVRLIVDSLRGMTALPSPFSAGDNADQLFVLGCAYTKLAEDSLAGRSFEHAAELYRNAGRPYDYYRSIANIVAVLRRRGTLQVTDSIRLMSLKASEFFRREGASQYTSPTANRDYWLRQSQCI